jgi:hypothetical protein
MMTDFIASLGYALLLVNCLGLLGGLIDSLEHFTGNSLIWAEGPGTDGGIKGVEIGEEALRDALLVCDGTMMIDKREGGGSERERLTIDFNSTVENIIGKDVAFGKVLGGDCGSRQLRYGS